MRTCGSCRATLSVAISIAPIRPRWRNPSTFPDVFDDRRIVRRRHLGRRLLADDAPLLGCGQNSRQLHAQIRIFGREKFEPSVGEKLEKGSGGSPKNPSKPLKLLALPREARLSKRIKHLPRSLGKTPSIVLQGVSAPSPKLIIQRDDGRFQVGLSDDAPAFETRQFAADVAALIDDTPDKRRSPRGGKREGSISSHVAAATRSYTNTGPTSIAKTRQNVLAAPAR